MVSLGAFCKAKIKPFLRLKSRYSQLSLKAPLRRSTSKFTHAVVGKN